MQGYCSIAEGDGASGLEHDGSRDGCGEEDDVFSSIIMISINTSFFFGLERVIHPSTFI